MHRNGTENGVERWRCSVLNIERFHARCARDPKYRIGVAMNAARADRRRSIERMTQRLS
jgi:hypothetical protein